MQLETIETMWAEDANINPLDLGSEALRVPQLHSRWYKIFLGERLALKQKEAQYKALLNDRYGFYSATLDEETLAERGWTEEYRNWSLKVLKSDIQRYLDGDKVLAKAALGVAYQKEKVEFLASIMDTIKYRGNIVRTALDWQKFTNGI